MIACACARGVCVRSCDPSNQFDLLSASSLESFGVLASLGDEFRSDLKTLQLRRCRTKLDAVLACDESIGSAAQRVESLVESAHSAVARHASDVDALCCRADGAPSAADQLEFLDDMRAIVFGVRGRCAELLARLTLDAALDEFGVVSSMLSRCAALIVGAQAQHRECFGVCAFLLCM